MRKFATYSGADLGDFFDRAEPIEAGGQRAEQRCRNSESRYGINGDNIAATFIFDQSGFQYAHGEFLDEQGNSICFADDLFFYLSGQFLACGYTGDDGAGLISLQSIERQHGHMRHPQPPRTKFRSKLYQDKTAGRLDRWNNLVDQLERTGINPVCVCERYD